MARLTISKPTNSSQIQPFENLVEFEQLAKG
jgi:hypothetical protein